MMTPYGDDGVDDSSDERCEHGLLFCEVCDECAEDELLADLLEGMDAETAS
jgi:hypothetical protein